MSNHGTEQNFKPSLELKKVKKGKRNKPNKTRQNEKKI